MLIDREKYTSHIDDKDRLIEMRRLIDKIELSVNHHSIQSTDFMDPYSIKLSESILNRFIDIEYFKTAAIENGERSIIYIYPDYMYPSEFNQLSFLRINGYTDKLGHRDFLGAVLNLGVKREKIGDILEHEGYVDIIVKSEIADFILYNLEKVGNENIKIKSIDIDELEPAMVDYEDIRRFLPSMRLDAYISSAYNISRAESSKLLKADKVKVNWKPINKSSYELSEGDIISIRGYGRSILNSIDGTSKKGRVNSVIRILI